MTNNADNGPERPTWQAAGDKLAANVNVIAQAMRRKPKDPEFTKAELEALAKRLRFAGLVYHITLNTPIPAATYFNTNTLPPVKNAAERLLTALDDVTILQQLAPIDFEDMEAAERVLRKLKTLQPLTTAKGRGGPRRKPDAAKRALINELLRIYVDTTDEQPASYFESPAVVFIEQCFKTLFDACASPRAQIEDAIRKGGYKKQWSFRLIRRRVFHTSSSPFRFYSRKPKTGHTEIYTDLAPHLRRKKSQ